MKLVTFPVPFSVITRPFFVVAAIIIRAIVSAIIASIVLISITPIVVLARVVAIIFSIIAI